MSRFMRDEQGWPGSHGHGLRRHAASPKYGDFSSMDGNRVAEIRAVKVSDTDGCRVADMDRSAVRTRKARTDLSCFERLRARHRPHRNDHRSLKTTRRLALQACPEHRHIGTHFHVPDRKTRPR